MSEAVNERIVSIIKVPQTVAAVEELELKKQTSELEQVAEALPVTNDEEYERAGEFGKMLKAKAGEVTSFFKPMKDAAYKAHKEVCEREKTMLAPLSKAERIIKHSMSAYYEEKEHQRREAEKAARLAAEEEARRRMEEAISLEQQGKTEDAEVAAEEAALIDSVSSTINVAPATPKMSGVSAKKDWEIVKVDENSVPISLAGITLRPVDEKAIIRLIRASKGSVHIPGVTYRETTSMSFSRR